MPSVNKRYVSQVQSELSQVQAMPKKFEKFEAKRRAKIYKNSNILVEKQMKKVVNLKTANEYNRRIINNKMKANLLNRVNV